MFIGGCLLRAGQAAPKPVRRKTDWCLVGDLIRSLPLICSSFRLHSPLRMHSLLLSLRTGVSVGASDDRCIRSLTPSPWHQAACWLQGARGTFFHRTPSFLDPLIRIPIPEQDKLTIQIQIHILVHTVSPSLRMHDLSVFRGADTLPVRSQAAGTRTEPSDKRSNDMLLAMHNSIQIDVLPFQSLADLYCTSLLYLDLPPSRLDHPMVLWSSGPLVLLDQLSGAPSSDPLLNLQEVGPTNSSPASHYSSLTASKMVLPPQGCLTEVLTLALVNHPALPTTAPPVLSIAPCYGQCSVAVHFRLSILHTFSVAPGYGHDPVPVRFRLPILSASSLFLSTAQMGADPPTPSQFPEQCRAEYR